MIITQNGEAKAVIQDLKSYEDSRNGNLNSQEEVFEFVEELFNR